MTPTFHDLVAMTRHIPATMQWMFQHGGCYDFHRIVKTLRPDAECHYDGEHVITRVDGRYLDATGEVEPGPRHDIIDPEVERRAREVRWSDDAWPTAHELTVGRSLISACRRLVDDPTVPDTPEKRTIARALGGGQ